MIKSIYKNPNEILDSKVRSFYQTLERWEAVQQRFEDDLSKVNIKPIEEQCPLSIKKEDFLIWLNDQTFNNKTQLFVHCTATDQTATVSAILNYWRNELNWQNPGYHIIIKPNGEYSILADLNRTVNGARGHNHNSIHISYIGGIDENRRPIDNRTKKQQDMLLFMIYSINNKRKLTVRGHNEVANKACPSFNVKTDLLRK